jgi:hypothetical protein
MNGARSMEAVIKSCRSSDERLFTPAHDYHEELYAYRICASISDRLTVSALGCRLGTTPVVVFNSIKAARDVFIGQGGSLIDKPVFYTFHSVLSSVASSIGTTPVRPPPTSRFSSAIYADPAPMASGARVPNGEGKPRRQQ